MLVPDEAASCWPTENLILKKGRKHYRTQISPIHWQLRSVISAEGNDVLYYPTGMMSTHIMRLDTRTRETETVKVLNFHPRCMVAKNGWICCGGENGEFAIIRDIGQTEEGLEAGGASSSGADEAALANEFRSHLNPHETPLRDDPSLTQFSRDMFNMLERRLNGPGRSWTYLSKKFGTERVNCITIWQPPKPTVTPPLPRMQNYGTPVAVLANNDKTITLVGLQDCEDLDELEYPDCVNRGVLSPNGTLLAAISDDPYLYIHARKVVKRGKTGDRAEWKPLPRIRLKDQKKQSPSDCRGSFAVCFSASGRYLAVGTQYGTISVFNVAAILEAKVDPLVTWFYSSRFPQDNGAVRDMAFCPGPFDLLAWAEHRGRIGVADARSNFTQRQVIALDTLEGVEHLPLNDRSTIDPRLLDHRSERNATTGGGSSSHLSNLLGRTGSPRPLPNPEPSDTADRLNHPFTQEETAILEAVQNDRRRREAREAREARDQSGQHVQRGSPAWRSSVWAERSNLRPTDRDTEQTALQTYREIAHMLRQQRETLTRILERERSTREVRDPNRLVVPPAMSDTLDRDRRAPTPRRRGSAMQSLSQNTDSAPAASASASRPQVSSGADFGVSLSRDSPTPWSRLTSGWADLEALYNISGGDSNAANDSASRTETLNRARRGIPVISDVWNDDLSGFASRQNYRRLNTRDHPQYPDDTAGLTWSEDGQTLWVATEDGIYEFRVNLQGRKYFPHISLR
ncbi:wd containing protein [Apiospora saccharicola]|uniref:Wd containing protein n=1 Tax=Apiospora saccharicola TaxID=335842 RepID=A0ABR1UL12_9PEZI